MIIGSLRIFILTSLVFSHLFSYAQYPFSKNKFIVIAHRGDHTNAPENTLKAFEDAIKKGVDFVEVDLRTTKDGELVVMHDETIDRMTNGQGKLSDFTYGEVQQMKVRDKDHPEWGEHAVPTFIEVMELCKRNVNIYLDFKDASVEKTYETIKIAGMERSIVVYINREQQYSTWRKVAPGIPLMISLPEEIDDLAKLKSYLEEIDAEIIDGSSAGYTKEKVELIHEMGRQVWADIQQKNENAEKWNAAIITGLDGLQTDHPRELITYLISEGIR